MEAISNSVKIPPSLTTKESETKASGHVKKAWTMDMLIHEFPSKTSELDKQLKNITVDYWHHTDAGEEEIKELLFKCEKVIIAAEYNAQQYKQGIFDKGKTTRKYEKIAADAKDQKKDLIKRLNKLVPGTDKATIQRDIDTKIKEMFLSEDLKHPSLALFELRLHAINPENQLATKQYTKLAKDVKVRLVNLKIKNFAYNLLSKFKIKNDKDLMESISAHEEFLENLKQR